MSVQASASTDLLYQNAPRARKKLRLRARVVHVLRPTIDILALGFATSVGMWAFGYIGHAPFASWPSAPFVGLMLLCVVAGGVVAGRNTRRGILGGILVGAFSAILNLLILGSVIKDPDTGQIVPSHLLWIPASILFQAALGGIGAGLGIFFPGRRNIYWKGVLATTFVILTLLLITAGGLVTGFKAGLAVPDWPNSYGSNMLLYPLKSMIEHQGPTHKGIFYEHAHRLLGMFVGLCSMIGPIYLTIADRRKRVVIASWGLLIGVIVQGAVLGALRVIGNYNLSTDPADQHPSTALALAHGITAHAILAGFVVLAVMCCRSYVRGGPAEERPSASTDRALAWLLACAVFTQSFLGTFVRHYNQLVLLHVTVAALVAVFALAVGTRAWGSNPKQPILRRFGIAILGILLMQLTLGILALAFRTPDLPVPSPFTAIITTLHQANAALLLATTVGLAMWTGRLVRMPSGGMAGEASI